MAMKTACRIFCVALPVVVVLILQQYVNLREELQSVFTSVDTAVGWNTNQSYMPKFRFQQLETCNKENLYVRVCVVRKALDSSVLESFVRNNEDGVLSLVREQSEALDSGSFHRKPMTKSLNDEDGAVIVTIGELLRGAAPRTYKGFGSFNYSSYADILNPVKEKGLFEGQEFPDRADIFAGDPSTTMVTASFHANHLEMSTTVQVVGEKLWNFITPQCWFHELKGYHIGIGFLAMADMSMETLERCTVTSTVAAPGDVIVFAKAWPHQIYTLPGPNLMVNLRSDAFNFRRPYDIIAAMLGVLTRLRTGESNPIRCNPNAALAPTAFSHGAPDPNTTFAKMKKKRTLKDRMDFRHCFTRPRGIDSLVKAQNELAPTKEVEAAILQQLGTFHGRVFL